jgi:hypothetical protein
MAHVTFISTNKCDGAQQRGSSHMNKFTKIRKWAVKEGFNIVDVKKGEIKIELTKYVSVVVAVDTDKVRGQIHISFTGDDTLNSYSQVITQEEAVNVLTRWVFRHSYIFKEEQQANESNIEFDDSEETVERTENEVVTVEYLITETNERQNAAFPSMYEYNRFIQLNQGLIDNGSVKIIRGPDDEGG